MYKCIKTKERKSYGDIDGTITKSILRSEDGTKYLAVDTFTATPDWKGDAELYPCDQSGKRIGDIICIMHIEHYDMVEMVEAVGEKIFQK